MGSEWAPIRLGSVCTKIGSGATPRGGSDVYLECGPYALIRSQNVYNDGFRSNGLVYIGEKHAAELDGVEVLTGDVLLNITGDSVARVCQVNSEVLPARVNQHVAIIRPDPDRLDPLFLRYFLVAPRMQAKLLSWAGSGGTRNALTKRMIESFDVLAPVDIPEQRAIAHILGTLDDKIELNRRMSETLEAMARALFKSWFVDFDPVRAKMEGRWRKGESLPGLPADLWVVFPDRLVDSELGEIPEGWEIGTIESICASLTDGDWIETKDQGGDAYRLLQISNIGVGCFVETGNYRYITQETYRRLNCTQALKDSVLISRMPSPTGRAWLVSEMPWKMIAAVDIAIAIVDNNIATPHFLVGHLNSKQNLALVSQYETGSTRARISRRDLGGLPLVVPQQQVQQAYSELARLILDKCHENSTENSFLSTLRDTLLPKLISGEIRVKDADKFVERAV